MMVKVGRKVKVRKVGLGMKVKVEMKVKMEMKDPKAQSQVLSPGCTITVHPTAVTSPCTSPTNGPKHPFSPCRCLVEPSWSWTKVLSQNDLGQKKCKRR